MNPGQRKRAAGVGDEVDDGLGYSRSLGRPGRKKKAKSADFGAEGDGGRGFQRLEGGRGERKQRR